MRHTRKFMLIAMILALALACAIPVFAQQQQPTPMAPTVGSPGVGEKTAPGGTVRGGALMPVDVYTPIHQGYIFVRQGNYEAARNQFHIATHRDELNPFALNNLAVLDERDGKLNDALAQFKDATIHAAQYRDKVSQTCFVGGTCMAVEPVRSQAATSEILPIIQDNIAKLEAKMAAAHTPPPSGNIPPMSPAPPAK
ncbi:MAG: tetratricopeptide repeat protein [Desulfobaccales bacterium]